jgi:hypothetical protein
MSGQRAAKRARRIALNQDQFGSRDGCLRLECDHFGKRSRPAGSAIQPCAIE